MPDDNLPTIVGNNNNNNPGDDMTSTTPNLHRDFDADNTGERYPTFDKMVHVKTTPHGVFRAVVEADHYPDAPYFDAGYPVVRIERGSYGGARFEMVDGLGKDSAAADGLEDDLATILQRVYDGGPDGYGSDNAGCHDVDETLEIVGRWLKAFHGGSLTERTESSIHQGGPDYVAYDTRAMRESWGQAGDDLETSAPNLLEWQAYIDGEVYLVSVEQATFDADGDIEGWTTVEDGGPVGGYYGDDYAAEAALEMLEDEIEATAAEMLPLEGAQPTLPLELPPTCSQCGATLSIYEIEDGLGRCEERECRDN